MLYNIYAVYNYVCSSIILSVKFAVSYPWPEVWSQGDAPECLEPAIRSFAIVCGGSGGGFSSLVRACLDSTCRLHAKITTQQWLPLSAISELYITLYNKRSLCLFDT